MPQATFWFASPFREWIGQRSLTLTWEGTLTLRDLWRRLARDYPGLRANLPREGLQEEAMGHLVAVIVDGDILTLDSVIRDGAKVDILAPLSGGATLSGGTGPGGLGSPRCPAESAPQRASRSGPPREWQSSADHLPRVARRSRRRYYPSCPRRSPGRCPRP